MALDQITYETLRNLPVSDVRQAIRDGAWTRHTAGLARGKLQCNLAILPVVPREMVYELASTCFRGGPAFSTSLQPF